MHAPERPAEPRAGKDGCPELDAQPVPPGLFGAELAGPTRGANRGMREDAELAAATEVELLRFCLADLVPENTGSELRFHARVLFTHRELPVRVREDDSAVCVSVWAGLWDEKNAVQDRAKSASIAAASARIAAAMSPSSSWAAGLQAAAAMYLCADIILLEVFFKAPDTLQFQNNFAGLVPVLRAGGGVRVLPVFNGMMWEQTPGVRCGVQSARESCAPHAGAAAVRAMFDQREIMVFGDTTLAAFNQERRRAPVAEVMYTRQNVYTYHFLYGVHSTVCNTQIWMKRHKLPRLMCASVLLRAFSRIGAHHEVAADSHFLKDFVLQAIAHAIQETYLGTASYRRDVCGEDIRTRVFWREMRAGVPLLPGGDCEDLAQTYAQLIYTVTTDYAWFLGSMPQYASFLMALFTPLGQMSCCTYLARGIYNMAGVENNHTFNVALHSQKASCHLALIENVQPTVVCPPHFDLDLLALRLERLEGVSSSGGNVGTGECESVLAVTTQQLAQEAYRYVLCMDEYMVFEAGVFEPGLCWRLAPGAGARERELELRHPALAAALERGRTRFTQEEFDALGLPEGVRADAWVATARGCCQPDLRAARRLHHGAQLYHQYADSACVVSASSQVPALLRMLETVGQHDARLVLITPAMFFEHWLALAHAAHCSSPAPTAAADLRELVLFEQYTARVLAPIARQAYAEDSRTAEDMCGAFYRINPALARELPRAPDTAPPAPGFAPPQHEQQLVHGCWGDAVFSMTPFWSAPGLGPVVAQGACAPYQHSAPSALLRAQMGDARVLAERAIDSFQRAAYPAAAGGPPVRAPVRALVDRVDGCLCGKYRDEFRARIHPLNLAGVRAALDAPQPAPYTHLALMSLLYETRGFMQHYAPPAGAREG